MALPDETIVLSSDDEYSSLDVDDEAYSADSELELKDLMDNGDDDSVTLSDCDNEHIPVNQSTNQTTVRIRASPGYSTVQPRSTISRDVVNEGLQLYMMFLQQEIHRNSLRPPEYFNRLENIMPRNLSSLRALADRFSTSSQRQWIRRQAQIVQLRSLNFNSFTDLLVGLFQEGGVTWERILVLFFFCTDISIRALQEQLTIQFQRIQNWTSHFIQETVCAWVEMEGGWAVVFQQSVNHATRIAILGFCCVGIIALCVYIRNNVNK